MDVFLLRAFLQQGLSVIGAWQLGTVLTVSAGCGAQQHCFVPGQALLGWALAEAIVPSPHGHLGASRGRLGSIPTCPRPGHSPQPCPGLEPRAGIAFTSLPACLGLMPAQTSDINTAFKAFGCFLLLLRWMLFIKTLLWAGVWLCPVLTEPWLRASAQPC